MKNLLIIITLLFIPVSAIAEPSLVFDEVEFKATKVKQGDVVEHTFTFTNAGTSDLIIKKVTSS